MNWNSVVLWSGWKEIFSPSIRLKKLKTYKGSNFWASIVDLTDDGEMYSIPKFSPPLHQSCLKLMCPSFLFPWGPSTFPLQMIYQLGAKLAGHRYVTDVGSCTSDDKAAEEGRSFYPQIPLIFQDTSLHKYTRYLIMIFWQLTSIDYTSSISVLEKLKILGKIECLDEGFCGKKKVSLGPTFVFKQGFIWYGSGFHAAL